MLDNLIFNNTDLFFDDQIENNVAKKVEEPVHISMQKRNGKKCITIIEGLANDLDLKKILKMLRKKLQTNGTVINNDDDEAHVIQLQGDKRNEVAELFVRYNVCLKESIILHGA